MGLLYKASKRELLTIRKKIFIETAIPELEKNGFVRSPFKTAWFGYDRNIIGYSYELCRVTKLKHLEIINAYILSGEKWVQIFLNIFQLPTNINSIEDLRGSDGLIYHLPPLTLTKMRLRNDDYKGPPLFYMLFCPEYKMGSSYTKDGLHRQGKKLEQLIKQDMANIDYFVKRWHELHKVSMVGNPC